VEPSLGAQAVSRRRRRDEGHDIDGRPKFWNALAMFWPGEYVDQLQRSLEEPGNQKVNLLVLGKKATSALGQR